MGEVLRSSNSIIVTLSGFSCQQQSHNPSRENGLFYQYGYFCRCLYLGSSMETKRKLFGRHGLNITFMSRKGFSFGVEQWKKRKMNFLYGYSKVANSIFVPNMVASVESGLACDEDEESPMALREKEEFNKNSHEQKLPPWGKFEVYKDSAFEHRDVSQPLTASKEMAPVHETGIHFLEERDEEILSKRILILSRCNKVRSALELLRSMELSGLRPNIHACNSLLSCLLRNNRLDDALRVFEFMKRNEIKTGHTYSLILKAVADSQGCDAALEMFVKLESEHKVKKHFDTVVYNTMISVCGKVNSWIQTQRIWRSMKENGKIGTAVTYRLLVCVFVRCGQNDLAIDAYIEMIQSGLKPVEDVMHAIIGACAKEGKCDLALSVLDRMLNDRLKPNPTACNALINLLGKGGKLKLAFKVYDLMKSLGHTPDAYTWNALLGALYRANRHADVLRLFESIKREQIPQLNLQLYNTALMSCQRLGLWDRAVQILWQMEGSELSASTASYNLVIGACEIARKPKVALQVYRHMVHEKCTPDTFTYLSLIRGCIWGSLWAEVEEILDVAPNVSLYNAVIHGMCLRGKVESAKKLYIRMRESGLKPDGKTRALMLQNLSRDSYRQKNRCFSHSMKSKKRRSQHQ